MFGQVLRQWFWDTYDHLGRLLLLNILLFFAVAPIAFYGGVTLLALAGAISPSATLPLLAAACAVIVPLAATPVCAGLFWFGKLASAEKDPPARAFLAGIRECGWPMAKWLLACGAIAGVLLFNVWCYFFSAFLPTEFRFLGYVLGGLCLWLLLFLAGVAMHGLPLVARGRRTVRQTLRLGALLTIKYPILTLTVLLFVAGMLALGAWLKLAGLIVYGFILPAMALNSLHDVIADAEARAEQDAADGKPAERPASWKQIRAQQDEDDEARMKRVRYERGWADLLRPWEM